MGRGIEQVFVVLERGLRAIAVMDVEIDDRHAFETVHIAGPQRADRGVVEKTETHRPIGFGMVPRRADRAECIVGLARDDRVDGGDHRAGGAQRRPTRGRGQHRVGVDRYMTRPWNGIQDALDMVARMHSQHIVDCRFRRLALLETGKLGPESAVSTARSRAGDSGWWIPGSCSRQAE